MVLADPAGRTVATRKCVAATVTEVVATVFSTRRVAGQCGACAGGYAEMVRAGLTSVAIATVLTSATAIADAAAVFPHAGPASDGQAVRPALAKIVLTGPAGWTGIAGNRATATVAQRATAVGASRWHARERRAIARGHALIVGTDFIISAATAVDAIAASVANRATVLARARAAGNGHARAAAVAQVVLARPPGLTAPARHLATTAVAQVAAAIGAAFRRTGERIARAVRRALRTIAVLAHDAATTVEAAAAPVADIAAILTCSSPAGERRAGRSALTYVLVAGPSVLAIAAGDLAPAAVAQIAAAVLAAARIASQRCASGRGYALIVGADLVGCADAAA